jgi:hypothetical protein
MSSIQTLYDVLFAVVLMVGISAALALAFVAAGAMHGRQQVRTAEAATGLVPAQQPARTDESRELTLR